MSMAPDAPAAKVGTPTVIALPALTSSAPRRVECSLNPPIVRLVISGAAIVRVEALKGLGRG